MSANSNRDEKSKQIQSKLFELPQAGPQEPKIGRLRHHIWTEHKAKFIERYLYYFVLITKHGTYIDGFAGPQRPSNPEMWAAKLVLESEPKRLRHFFLFDNSKQQIQKLQELGRKQPKVKGRTIQIFSADFNREIRDILRCKAIRQTEATFCLLDQRTFECHWQTLVELANYKEAGQMKIELFYFLAVMWLRRSLSATRKERLLAQFWGRDDWPRLKGMTVEQIKDEIVARFKSELRYKSAKPWPIYERKGSDTIVYYMIHATDHPEAPKLMLRAYHHAIQPKETPEQFNLAFEAGLQDEQTEREEGE